jgi:hypothetical protein
MGSRINDNKISKNNNGKTNEKMNEKDKQWQEDCPRFSDEQCE